MRRTFPDVRARPRVRVAVNEYSQQFARVGALEENTQMGQFKAWYRAARESSLSLSVNEVSEGLRARRVGSAGASTRCVFKAVMPVVREGRALDALHADVLLDDVALRELATDHVDDARDAHRVERGARGRPDEQPKRRT